MTVFFGPMPPWLPLTLHSMEANSGVDFIVVGDAAPPSVLPPNVRFQNIPYDEMQRHLAQLTGKPVTYTNTYKANDIKPLLPALYPQLFVGYEWWGWADLDVVFGDLLKYLSLAEPQPACCKGLEVACNKRARRDRSSPCFNSSRPQVAADTFFDRRACPCTAGETVTAVSPLYPNPWRKKCWGPFTLFKASMGLQLFESAAKWKDALSTWEYTHFDEWWGPFTQRGYESMGDVMTRLSDEGALVMSRTLLPFAEAKSCVDIECTFCPCGATTMRLDGKRLIVNGEESMILHLAESKQGWMRTASALAPSARQSSALPGVAPASGVGGALQQWALPAYERREAPGTACYEVEGLGALSPDDIVEQVAPTATAALRYARHRPTSAKAAAALVYFKRNGSESERSTPPLVVRACGGGGGGSGIGASAGGESVAGQSSSSSVGTLESARRALQSLVARYDAFTAGERLRTLEWLCAWQRLSDLYADLVEGLDLSSKVARGLPEVNGNRRVRTPMYGGERLGWWRQTVNTSVAAAGGACRPDANEDCKQRRWPEESKRRRGRGRHGRKLRRNMVPAQPRSDDGDGAYAAVSTLPGRMLRAKRAARYDLNTPPVPGVACLPLDSSAPTVDELREQMFSGYLQLQHARRAEYGRTQRWMCSWLYKLRACRDAERAQRVLPASGAPAQGRCRSIAPPDQTSAGLGWRGYRVNEVDDLAPLLFQFRCW